MRRARRRSPEEVPLSGGVGSDLAWILVLAFFVAFPNDPIGAIPIVEPHFCGKRVWGHERPEILIEPVHGNRVVIDGALLDIDDGITRLERWWAHHRRGHLILQPRPDSENGTLVRLLDRIHQSRILSCDEVTLATFVD